MTVLTRLMRIVNRILGRFGVKVQRVPINGFRTAQRTGSRLYVGCGHDRRPGYLGCDLRSTPTVDLVCRAWEISRYLRDLSEIYSRHMLEHLTYGEVATTLADWHDALRVGGRVHIVVPNLDFHIEQWQRAQWTADALDDKHSDAAWSIAGFYGWQQQCDPRTSNYDTSYWDVHKSGFNANSLRFHLEQAGFDDIETSIEDQCHLEASAVKKLDKYERQVGPSLRQIRPDHRARYEFALDYVQPGNAVLDIACGVGYGSRMVGQHVASATVLALDIAEDAIRYAERHYSAANVDFIAANALEYDFDGHSFDIILSFETLEHLDAQRFLARLRELLNSEGRLICSTPNEAALPYNPTAFPYHQRHYTPDEFEQLLDDAGFRVLEKFSQMHATSGEIVPGWDGKYNIAVCALAHQ